MAVDPIIRVVNEQRKRCQAGILGGAEQSAWWGRLSREEQVAFRAKVVDSLAVFYDLCRDVIKVSESDETMLRNEHAINLIEAIYARLNQ